MTEKAVSRIKTCIVPANVVNTAEILMNKNVLGVIEFSNNTKNYGDAFSKSNMPYLQISIKPFLHESYFEVWYSSRDVVYGKFKDLQYATDGYHFFGAISMEETVGPLDHIGKTMYNHIFESMREFEYPHIFRLWNYLPYINDFSQGTERYKLFCHGRASSFQNNSTELIYPSATGVGTWGNCVNIYFISTINNIHKNIENPKQTPAYRYPSVNGLKAPSFSRGTYSEYSQDANSFYISGTASILGHQTAFEGDIKKQCETTIANIDSLISKVNLLSYGINQEYNLKDLDCIKVYIKNNADFEVVKSICEDAFSLSKSIVYLNTDICRKNLLVEIEGLIQR